MLPAGPPERRIVDMVRWLRRRCCRFLDELSARYGNVFTMRLPRLVQPVVVFAEPSAVRDLWTGDPDTLHAGEAKAILRSVLGEQSLLLLDGERHLRERRLMLPPFHGDRMRAYGEAMRDATSRVIDRWPLGRAFLIHGVDPERSALDVIMRTIFGVDNDDPRLAPLRDAVVRWTTLGTSRLGNALLLLVPPERARTTCAASPRAGWGSTCRGHRSCARRRRPIAWSAS